MSEFSVSFIETFSIQADTPEEAIATAKAKYPFFLQGVNSVTCEIVPQLMKETV